MKNSLLVLTTLVLLVLGTFTITSCTDDNPGTSATELWSASKISTDVLDKLSKSTGGTVAADVIVQGDITTQEVILTDASNVAKAAMKYDSTSKSVKFVFA